MSYFFSIEIIVGDGDRMVLVCVCSYKIIFVCIGYPYRSLGAYIDMTLLCFSISDTGTMSKCFSEIHIDILELPLAWIAYYSIERCASLEGHRKEHCTSLLVFNKHTRDVGRECYLYVYSVFVLFIKRYFTSFLINRSDANSVFIVQDRKGVLYEDSS